MARQTIDRDQAEALAMAALSRAGMPEDLAATAARALVQADQDGLASHGLARLPFYVAQMASGKVVANARPQVTRDGAVIRVDAGHGLAFAAIAAGAGAAQPVARDLGLAAIAIRRSHHFGVAGQAVEPLARAGFLALAFSNTPAAMAPWGGTTPVFGTNPIAFAAPTGADPLVIDLSLSHVARGKVMLAQKAGQPIPEGWALDAAGQPTTDASAAMAGSMVPSGGAKGAALALMVEMLTAGLVGGNFGHQASSLFEAEGAPPDLSHLILVFEASRFAPGFSTRAAQLFEAIAAQPGARLPGTRRLAARAQPITLPDGLLATLRALAAP
ncbi:MAG: Ldh family oxidoreductase [Pseudorhodobacter sp.]